jgi:hypothetical protein
LAFLIPPEKSQVKGDAAKWKTGLR